MPKVLIIGSSGQVSTYLQRAFQSEPDYEIVVSNRESLDLSNPQQVRTKLANFDVDIVINAAAYTAVDLAEEETDLAYAINRDSVGEIALHCKQAEIPLIHYSTDYVFPGDADTPYSESDATGPNGVYGQSKLEGEQAVIESGAQAVVLRTSWVYSNHGKNFYKTMLALSESRDELSVVADQIGAPTYAGSIADATVALIRLVTELGGIPEDKIGVYHFSCQGHTSWSDFAMAIFEQNGISHMTVNPITTSEYPTPAKRPAYSVMSGDKLQQKFGLSLPSWQDALSDCVAEST